MFKEKLKKGNNKKGKSDRAVALPCGLVLCTYNYYRANVIPACSVLLFWPRADVLGTKHFRVTPGNTNNEKRNDSFRSVYRL